MSINSNVGTRNVMFVAVFVFVPAALMSISRLSIVVDGDETTFSKTTSNY